MNNKILFPTLAALFIAIMAIYFLVNPSYEKSIEAKYYYEIGDYDEAYKLANEAFSIDVYNRMAATIMAQSKTSLKYKKYIDQAKQYMQEINKIAEKETISDADRARIKLMSEIMVDSYKKLAPSDITNTELVREAAKYYSDFEKLLEKVNR
jgi:tRNA U34 5-carboxymethylaminomethyl modifying enzyme MnmG/GidA